MNIVEILGKIGFDWRMALANLVNFLIIFWLLKRFAWKPIQKMLADRQQKIDQGLEDAKKTAAELTMAEENYKNKINQAKKEANLIIAKASDQGQALINTAAAEASAKAKKILTDSQVLIQQEKKKMMAELRQDTVALSLAIAEKIIREKLDQSKDQNLIKTLIAEN